jgi:hypothetical protein
MKRGFVIAVLTYTILSFAMGQNVNMAADQSDNAEQEIIKIEREWVESRSNSDAAFSENLLADDCYPKRLTRGIQATHNNLSSGISTRVWVCFGRMSKEVRSDANRCRECYRSNTAIENLATI